MRTLPWAMLLGLLACAALAQGAERPPGRDAEPGEEDAHVPGKPVLVLEPGGHTAPVHNLLLTPDGKRLISLGMDKAIRIWSTDTGEIVRVLRPRIGPGDQGQLAGGALSPDGNLLAVGGWRIKDAGKFVYPVYLIDLRTGALRTLLGHSLPVLCLAFSPDGERVASGGRDGTARVWSVADESCLLTLKEHTGIVHDLAFGPKGHRLVTVSADKTGRIWSVKSGECEHVLEGSPGPLWAVAWSADGKTIVTGGYDDTALRVWGPNGETRMTVPLAAQETVVKALAFRPLPGGGTSADEVAITWHSVPTLKAVRNGVTFVNLATKERKVAITLPDCGRGTTLATALTPELAANTGGDNNSIYLWRPADGKVIHQMAGFGRPVHSVAWSKREARIAWGTPRTAGDFSPPLSASLSLEDLTLARKVDPSQFQGPFHSLGDLKVVRTGPRDVEVRKGDKALATVTRRVRIDAFTLIHGDRLAVSSGISIFLYEASTGKFLVRAQTHRDRVHGLAATSDGKYLLSASEDQTIRITALPDRLQGILPPFLTIFTAGTEWVAWVPAGYYAASPGGENLMGWQVGGDLKSLASFYPARQFRASLYRPDVISRLLSAGSLAKAIEAADKGATKKAATVEVADVLPPEVTLTAPDLKDGKISDGTVEVQAVALSKSKHPIVSLQLMLDGQPYLGSDGRRTVEGVPVGKEVREKWTFQVPEGEHSLRVIARTEASMGLSDDIEVDYVKPAPLPKLFVLAIGIDNYAKGVPPLHCAVNDARELKEVFQTNSKGLFEVVPRLLKDARKKDILEALGWLKGMTARDVAVIFYAGHGERDDKGGFYLLPQDADLADLANTAISGSALKAQLTGLRGKVVLLLDACHSGAVGKVINELARDLSDEDCGVLVLCAALGSETAGEDKALKHGYFCLAILEALRGEASKSARDGYVYQHHLEQHVIDRVQQLSNDAQHPTSAKPALRPFPLAKP